MLLRAEASEQVADGSGTAPGLWVGEARVIEASVRGSGHRHLGLHPRRSFQEGRSSTAALDQGS